MKALVVTPYYHPKIGGLEIYARQLGIALRDIKKWEIVVVTSNHEGRKTVVDTVDGMTVYRLGTWFKLSNTPIGLLWPLQIRNIIRREKPNLVLAHAPVPSMADAAAVAVGKTPLLLIYHAATLIKGDSPLFNAVAHIYGIFQKFTFSRATKILAVSDYVKTSLGPKLASKTLVLPNAVWKRDITQRQQPQGAHFLFVGSLDRTHAWKGLDDIIDATALFRDKFGTNFTLTVMGDGNDRARYEARVQQANLSGQVTFLGQQTGEAKDAAFKQASALVMYPTTANDAFPTVMIEAWAKGVPVIGASIGPIPSLLNDKQDGYLVKPHDPTALAATLYTVAVSSTEERNSIAAAGAQRVRDSYTWEYQAERLAAIAQEVL
ncbi:MAG TPA: glycosyltransferase family 4 protein [Patescibacteria group bacterium]|nr:glycosyltransferase family 4 protein [Patescibacteria group bacterium]